MIKNRFFFILIIFFAILVSMKVVPSFRGEVLRFSNKIKLSYLSIIDDIKHKINTHTKQAQRIDEL
jgi:hypothetical protein